MNQKFFIFIIISSMVISSFSAFAVPPSFVDEVINSPVTQDVNIVNEARLQIEVQHVTHNFVETVYSITVPSPIVTSINDGVVPMGKKMILTDVILRPNGSDSTLTAIASIYTGRSGSDCSNGSFFNRLHLYVPHGLSKIFNLKTGIEFYEGQRICLGSESTSSMSWTIYGYLTDM